MIILSIAVIYYLREFENKMKTQTVTFVLAWILTLSKKNLMKLFLHHLGRFVSNHWFFFSIQLFSIFAVFVIFPTNQDHSGLCVAILSFLTLTLFSLRLYCFYIQNQLENEDWRFLACWSICNFVFPLLPSVKCMFLTVCRLFLFFWYKHFVRLSFISLFARCPSISFAPLVYRIFRNVIVLCERHSKIIQTQWLRRRMKTKLMSAPYYDNCRNNKWKNVAHTASFPKIMPSLFERVYSCARNHSLTRHVILTAIYA